MGTQSSSTSRYGMLEGVGRTSTRCPACWKPGCCARSGDCHAGRTETPLQLQTGPQSWAEAGVTEAVALWSGCGSMGAACVGKQAPGPKGWETAAPPCLGCRACRYWHVGTHLESINGCHAAHDLTMRSPHGRLAWQAFPTTDQGCQKLCLSPTPAYCCAGPDDARTQVGLAQSGVHAHCYGLCSAQPAQVAGRKCRPNPLAPGQSSLLC